MKKFLLPIINLVNVVLVSITFGLGGNSAYSTVEQGGKVAGQNWYSLVWTPIENGSNAVGVVGFFLFVFAALFVLLAWIPVKTRKVFNLLAGGLLIASGAMMLNAPVALMRAEINQVVNSNSLIAMGVLLFIAGGLALVQLAIDLIPSKKQ